MQTVRKKISYFKSLFCTPIKQFLKKSPSQILLYKILMFFLILDPGKCFPAKGRERKRRVTIRFLTLSCADGLTGGVQTAGRRAGSCGGADSARRGAGQGRRSGVRAPARGRGTGRVCGGGIVGS